MSQPNPSYRPDIDGLRAVAVLSVMLYHLNSSWLPGGFVGVDVFFVISGYVVTAALAANPGQSLGSFLSEFYARRLARILPALTVVLLFTGVLAVVFIPQAWLSQHGDETARHALFGLSNWFLQQNVGNYFAPRAELNPYTHTWSLGVEEQFYLLAPFLVFWWRSQLRSSLPANTSARHASTRGLILLTTASMALCAWASGTHPSLAFYFIGCRVWELALGALLFMLTQSKSGEDARSPALIWAPYLGAGLLAGSLAAADLHQFPWPWALAATSGAMLLIGGVGAARQHPLRRMLGSPAAVWIGLRSYSLYLWHWPVFVLLRWTVGLESAATRVAAVVLTLMLATASYRWIERPLRHHPRLESKPRWLRIAGFLTLPALALLLLNHLFDHRATYSLASASRVPQDWLAKPRMERPELGVRSCAVAIDPVAHGAWSESIYRPHDCTSGQRAQTVFVVGDSHAGAMAQQFEQFSAATGTTVRILSVGGCGYLNFKRPMATDTTAGCAAFTSAATELLQAQARAGDIVFLASLRLERYGDQWASYEVSDMFGQMYGPQAAAARLAATEEAQRLVSQWTQRGLQVLFAAPLPIFKSPAFRCIDAFNRSNPICKDGLGTSTAELQRLRAPVMAAMHGIQLAHPQVRIWDPYPLLCPANGSPDCSSVRDGRPLFFDGDHLSAFGNAQLYPNLSAALLQP